jgi:peptidoglycan hydrolase CwlO-like protein
MLKPLEQRVDDLEDLVSDIPNLINLRLETLISNQHEANARIALLDRQITTLVRDVRDMRGGVTRQLVAQDKEIAEIKADVASVKADVTSVRADITSVKAAVASVEVKIDRLEIGIAEVLVRLPRS